MTSSESMAANVPGAARPGDTEKLLRLPAVLETVGLCRTAWLDLVRAGKAPAPVRIGRATAWPSSEIQQFIHERIRESRGVS